MKPITYDLHLHSCLSPCGDREMTPNNIAGMASLASIGLLALTDHNATGNCRPFFHACRRYGIVPVAGCELTTAEDIHLVCLFPSLDAAEAFGADLARHRVRYPNRPEIFGEQLLLGEEDEVLGFEHDLLPNATDLPMEDAFRFASLYGALVYPAHIDREANGIIAALGAFPEQPRFPCFELHHAANQADYRARYCLGELPCVISSDAHYLWDISDGEQMLSLEGESEDEIRTALFRTLGGGAL